MGTISEKLTYLNETKTQLKGMINYGLDENNKIINETTFRDYVKSIFKAFLESLNNPNTLFTNLPKKTGTGSNITLNDTANAPMKIKLSASEMSQSGTPAPESPQDIHTISGDNTIKVKGKNVVNALDISSMINFTKDNNVFTSSALTSTGYGGIASTKFTNDVYIPNNSTIYISADIRLVSGTTETLNVIGDRSLLRLNASWVEKPTLSNHFQRYCYKYDVNAGDSFTGFFVQLYNCSNAVLEVKNVMFSYSNKTEYESYVSQEADINLGVKNLYDFRNYKLANQSLLNRTELIDGSYQFTSTGSGYAYAQYNLSLPAGTYSYKIETDTGSNYTVLNGQTSVSNPFTINETTTIAFRIFIANAVAGNQVVLKNIILEKGTKVQEASDNPIEYCKIGNYEDEFIRTSGKNKCNITGLTPSYYSSGLPSGSSNQIAVDSFDNNNITFHSTSANYNMVLSNVIQLKPNTQYTIKFSRTSTATNNQWFIYDYNNGTYSVNYRDNNTNVYEYTFTTNSLGQIVLAFGHGNTTGTTTISNIMINEGETPLPYEPYGTNEWYIKKSIGKVVLDGSVRGSIRSDIQNENTICYRTDAGITNIKSNVACLSNYFECKNNVSDTEHIRYIGASGYRFQIFLLKTTATTDEQVQTWLSTHNTEVYYILANPTYTQITGTLAEQLENIYQKLKSFKGTTNISQVNNDLPFVLNVQALEDLE